MLLLALLLAAAPADRVLVSHDFYPGFMPGAFGRTSLALTLQADGGAQLVVDTAVPPQEQRRSFNPTAWLPDAGTSTTLTGTVKARAGERFTVTFPETVLTCAPKNGVVHPAGARVTEPATCSPCYDGAACREPPLWTPPGTHTRAGFSCRFDPPPAFKTPASLAEQLFFSPAPGVEHVVGRTDCPPGGLREPGDPVIDWTLFPEGTTALREVSGSLKRTDGVTTRTLVVTRKGSAVEVRADGQVFEATTRDGAAVTRDGAQQLALSCWGDRQLVHSTDLRFEFGRDVCEGEDERPRSRRPATLAALRCLELREGRWRDAPLVFVPRRVVEQLDLDADCTKRRAVRLLPSLDAPPF